MIAEPKARIPYLLTRRRDQFSGNDLIIYDKLYENFPDWTSARELMASIHPAPCDPVTPLVVFLNVIIRINAVISQNGWRVGRTDGTPSGFYRFDSSVPR